MTGGLGMAAGVLGVVGSYAAVRKMYQNLKKRRMQKLLDDAQIGFAETSAQEADAAKQASQQPPAAKPNGRPFGMLDTITSSPVAATLLLMLGSGALTHSYLNKTFPAVKSAKPPTPKRVIVKYRDPEEEDVEKTASFSEDDGFEFIIKTLLAGMAEKSASDLANIIYACAEGRSREIEESLEFGLDTSLDLIKGASIGSLSDDQVNLGISLALRNPVLEPTVKLLACAEWNDMTPSSVKLASTLEDDQRASLAGLVCALGLTTRVTSEKHASQMMEANPELIQELLQQISPEAGGALGDLQEEDSSGVDTENATTDSSQEGGGALGAAHTGAAAALGEASANDDIIDEIMGGGAAETLQAEAQTPQPSLTM